LGEGVAIGLLGIGGGLLGGQIICLANAMTTDIIKLRPQK